MTRNAKSDALALIRRARDLAEAKGLEWSLYPKNPVLGCYGCIKFIPGRDARKHEQVTDPSQPVVRSVEEVISDQSESKSGEEGGDVHDPKRKL